MKGKKQQFRELTPDQRPQDPRGDGTGLRFETGEHGGVGCLITTSVSSSLPTKPTWLRCGIDQALLLTLSSRPWQAFTLEQAHRVFDCIIRPNCEVWVGTLDERVVAYSAMKGTYIDRLYVDPLEWRKGWGTQLVNIAKQVSPFGLELHTHQDNFPARVFYERHGFRAVKFGLSPPPESAPDVEYHRRPA